MNIGVLLNSKVHLGTLQSIAVKYSAVNNSAVQESVLHCSIICNEIVILSLEHLIVVLSSRTSIWFPLSFKCALFGLGLD